MRTKLQAQLTAQTHAVQPTTTTTTTTSTTMMTIKIHDGNNNDVNDADKFHDDDTQP
jgi:hypothetical protein